MSGITSSPRKVYIRTLIVWSLLSAGLYCLMLLSPPDASGEWYANTWSFRTMVFVLFLLPVMAVFLGFVLFAEAAYFKWKLKE